MLDKTMAEYKTNSGENNLKIDCRNWPAVTYTNCSSK